jgi:hypothetical protein
MHSAATATGRPLPPPGKTLLKNRPAPLSCRAAHQLAAPKSHVTYVTSHRQCYVQAHASTRHSSRVTSHDEINRKPRRLEFVISPTKQTPAAQFNRRQTANSRITNLPRWRAGHYSPITTHSRSNRQWQILEITVNLSKQTMAPRSNRHKNAIFGSRFPTRPRRSPKRVGRGPRLTIHSSCLNQTLDAAHSVPRPLVPPQYPPVRNFPHAPAPLPTRATFPVDPRASTHPQSRPETSSAVYTQSSHSQPDSHRAPAAPRRTAYSLLPTQAPGNFARLAFPSPASTPNAANPPGAQGFAPASASSRPRETPQNPAAPLAKSSLRDKPE